MASIFRRKKGGSYYISYEHRGRRVKRSLRTKDRTIALECLRLQENELARDAWGIAPPDASASTMLELYENQLKVGGASGRNLRDQVRFVRRFLEAVGDPGRPMAPGKVRPADLERWRDRRLEEVSPARVRRQLDTVFAAFAAAHRAGLIRENPCVRVAKPKVGKRLVRFLSRPDVRKVLAAARSWRDGEAYGMVATAIYAGLRQAELLYLDWADVDLARRVLLIRAKDGWQPKSKQERLVPMHDELLEALDHPSSASGPCWPGTDENGRRGRTYMKGAINGIGKLAEVEKLGWHLLRHTFASHLVMEGVSIFKVSRFLGHSTVRVTEDHYAHLAPERLHADINRASF